MDASILIVTRNRPKELAFTLNKLESSLDLTKTEVLIFIDGCPETELICSEYTWVKWKVSKENIGASPARNKLYKDAIGKVFIGLDDDAHPVTENFIHEVYQIFINDSSLGIIAFQEIRSSAEKVDAILQKRNKSIQQYYINNFIGCGFAIRKDVYDKTNGFPVWMDIYGEESCVAIEVLDLGYSILYTEKIIVNHRVDKENRIKQGRNYYRFEKLITNRIYYHLIYYPKPYGYIKGFLKYHFLMYAIRDFQYFKLFWKSLFIAYRKRKEVLQFKKQIKPSTFHKIRTLHGLKFYEMI
jgi:GT2 family glycosyltransferase